MLFVSNGEALARVLNTPLEGRLKDLLITRRHQLGGDIKGQAHFTIVQPGDAAPAIEEALGFSPFHNPVTGNSFGDPDFTPAWEWLEDHGHCFEAAFILDDSGFAYVLIVPKEEGIEPYLLALCTTYTAAHAQ